MSGISTNITSLLAQTLIILLPFHLIQAHLLTPVPRLTFHSLTADKAVLFPAVQCFIYPCSGFCSFPFPHRAWQSISCFLSSMFHVLLSFWIFPINTEAWSITYPLKKKSPSEWLVMGHFGFLSVVTNGFLSVVTKCCKIRLWWCL